MAGPKPCYSNDRVHLSEMWNADNSFFSKGWWPDNVAVNYILPQFALVQQQEQ